MKGINAIEKISNGKNVADYAEALAEDLDIVFSLNEARVKLHRKSVKGYHKRK